ncbi:MAG: outer membrane lipoprotein chaperone LolA [Pseudomonadales bacterium]|nr:outer membrane lipoprotein chaperone LolA [Pseudomonadales bacterium]MDP6473080.1 outer membrane lipoprotein chaperone LolA [Pseudomonadales bacterium]MDP6826163.1 outer membrane lipoprotein chaperone LolA [Pseudomonadales bacterium]MDP6971951.1 outer membrane lipoprotein chaperone LolA [Pseudomonadales bacterium]
MKYWFLIAISLCWTTAWGDSRAALSDLLANHDNLVAGFEQEIRGGRNEVLERSTGRMLLKRPLFRWEIDTPYPQMLVADGETLKIYDPDLEQLMVRTLDAALDHTPLAVLTRHDVVLAENYDIAEEDGSYILRPKATDALFAEVTLGFEDGILSALTIRDHLGQVTFIRFNRVQTGAVLQSTDFVLDVPPGTDVIEG